MPELVVQRKQVQRSPGQLRGHPLVRVRASLLAIVVGVTLAIASFAAQPASAATFDVEVFDDWPAQEPGVGTCRSTRLDGKCTLRAAIMRANSLPGAHTINVPPGTYQLTRTGVDDAGRVGDLDILGEMTIRSRGSGVVTIAGLGFQSEDRVIHVIRPAVATIQNVVVQGGYLLNRPHDNDGGGILVDYHARLTLTDVMVRNNRALSNGGGISIRSGGYLELVRSSVEGNEARNGNGGGIASRDAAVYVRQSTVAENRAGQFGGGIWIHRQFATGGGVGSVWLSTVSSNTAGRNGGGIFYYYHTENDGGGFIHWATIARNSAPEGGNVTVRKHAKADGPWAINSIVADPGSPSNCEGRIDSVSGNLDSGTSCGFVRPNDIQNRDPFLQALHHNGGPTRTHAPFSHSPAIDAAPDCFATADAETKAPVDQRRMTRPQDGNKDGSVACDIGAFERQP